MKPPIFRPAAAADVEDAYRWYEEQRTGLGDEFLVAVTTVVESLIAYPESFPIVYRQTRRASLRRFPYSLFYRIIDDQVIVVACMHGRRHPRRWQSRNYCNNDNRTAKIVFHVPNEDGSFEVETLWGYDLGDDRYKIDNVPFYAYSVSLNDVVYAPADPEEERPTFQKVLTKSGNRTIRVVFDPPIEAGNRSEEVLKGLVSLGCTAERANSKYVAINVPPAVDLNSVRDYLVKSDAQWEHADPTYDELYPADA